MPRVVLHFSKGEAAYCYFNDIYVVNDKSGFICPTRIYEVLKRIALRNNGRVKSEIWMSSRKGLPLRVSRAWNCENTFTRSEKAIIKEFLDLACVHYKNDTYPDWSNSSGNGYRTVYLKYNSEFMMDDLFDWAFISEKLAKFLESEKTQNS